MERKINIYTLEMEILMMMFRYYTTTTKDGKEEGTPLDWREGDGFHGCAKPVNYRESITS